MSTELKVGEKVAVVSMNTGYAQEATVYKVSDCYITVRIPTPSNPSYKFLVRFKRDSMSNQSRWEHLRTSSEIPDVNDFNRKISVSINYCRKMIALSQNISGRY